MKEVLADTYYYLALVSADDHAHSRAVALARDQSLRHIVHCWVLAELADALAPRNRRDRFLELWHLLRDDEQVVVLPASDELFKSGVRFYSERPDKDWSLTDCVSFVVMRERGMRDALTGDRHFEQAGFNALLK